MTPPPSTDELLHGRYRLLEPVGEGGMAVVWRARDELLGRVVAVKILRPQYAGDPDFLARLYSEARSAAALNDPGVVGVYDVGEDGGRHYIVMEFVPGGDLKTVIRDQAPLSPERTVEIGVELSRAVAQAHALAMVHRDIKPQNVLVGADGRMKVADFGIARAAAAVGSTAPGIVLGTVHYIAPEQAAGGQATPASDVYSLGVVLYEMLTGSLPFDADSSVGVAMKIMNDVADPVDRVNPRVPSALAGIVHRAMSRNPAERYRDAAALADALDGYARWSHQVTGSVPPVAAAGRDRISAPAVPPRTPRGPQPRAGSVPVGERAALLDWTGLALAVLALLALSGLIPLWGAVRERVRMPAAPVGITIPGLSRTPAGVPTVPSEAPPVPTTIVPGVVGMEQADAEAEIRKLNLALTVSMEESSTIAAGRVIRQVPEPGGSVPEQTVIEIVVSGAAQISVPLVEGDWTVAADTIKAVGLLPVQRSQWGAAAGQVVAVDPKPGTRLPAGATVHVTVGSGTWLPLGVDFADKIHLSGVDVPSTRVRPGESVTFTAVWEATDTELTDASAPQARADYVVRAVLEGEGGVRAATDEHVPVGGARPTSSWQPGEVIRGDAFVLPVDPGSVPGEYTLWLDLYAAGEPDRVLDVVRMSFGRPTGNRVQLLAVTVEAPVE